MSCSILVDTILSKDSTPSDLVAAFKEGFEKEFAGAGLADIGPSTCPKYAEYLPAAVSALVRACLHFGHTIHEHNNAFPSPTADDLTPPGLVKLPDDASPAQIFDAMKGIVLPRLLDYLRNSLKWCRENRIQVNLDSSLKAGFGGENFLAAEWDLIVYLNFVFPRVPAARGKSR